MVGGQGADAEVDLCLVHAHFDAAVLGEAFFGDVDAGHDLDAADEGALHAFWDAVALDTLAVNAVADADAVFHGLDMDIGGAVANGLDDHGLHELDDGGLGGVVDGILAHSGKVDGLVDGAIDGLVEGFIEGLEGGVDGFVDGLVGARGEDVVEIAFDAALGRQDGADFAVEAEAKDVEGFQVQWVVDGDAQLAVLDADGHDQVLAHEIVGDGVDDVGGNGTLVEVDVLEVVLGGQGLVNIVFGGEFEFEESLSYAQVLLLGIVDRPLLLLGIQDAPLNENFAQFLLVFGHNVSLTVTA